MTHRIRSVFAIVLVAAIGYCALPKFREARDLLKREKEGLEKNLGEWGLSEVDDVSINTKDVAQRQISCIGSGSYGGRTFYLYSEGDAHFIDTNHPSFYSVRNPDRWVPKPL